MIRSTAKRCWIKSWELWKMKLETGSYVRIAAKFPSNRNLASQTGTIESLPNREHRREYLVKLDGGMLSPHLSGMLVWVPSSKLELANNNWRFLIFWLGNSEDNPTNVILFCWASRCLFVNSTDPRFPPRASRASVLGMSPKCENCPVTVLSTTLRKNSRSNFPHKFLANVLRSERLSQNMETLFLRRQSSAAWFWWPPGENPANSTAAFRPCLFGYLSRFLSPRNYYRHQR